jgi:hypothetical protein
VDLQTPQNQPSIARTARACLPRLRQRRSSVAIAATADTDGGMAQPISRPSADRVPVNRTHSMMPWPLWIVPVAESTGSG